MSGTATLSWFSDRGFELELSADLEDIQLRFAALPVPADGTIELAEGVELNKLDILFKCQAGIDGPPAQLQDAVVAVRDGKLPEAVCCAAGQLSAAADQESARIAGLRATVVLLLILLFKSKLLRLKMSLLGTVIGLFLTLIFLASSGMNSVQSLSC